MYNTGRTEEAEDLHPRALDIRTSILGKDHQDVAKVLHSLGICVAEAGRSQEAEELLRRALQVQQGEHGGDTADAKGTPYYSLGPCVYRVERETMADQSLPLAEEKVIADHGSLHDHGLCAWNSGRRVEAEGILRQALKVEEKEARGVQTSVATTLHILGVCAYRRGRAEEGEDLLRRALQMRKNSLGSHHVDVASTLHELGLCLHTAGYVREAEGCFRRALGIYKTKRDTDLPRAHTMHELALCVSKEEAKGLLRQALAIMEEKLGADDPNVGKTRGALCLCMCE